MSWPENLLGCSSPPLPRDMVVTPGASLKAEAFLKGLAVSGYAWYTGEGVYRDVLIASNGHFWGLTASDMGRFNLS